MNWESFRSKREIDIDNALQDHLDWMCDEERCPWCKQEREERELYERKSKKLDAMNALFDNGGDKLLKAFDWALEQIRNK